MNYRTREILTIVLITVLIVSLVSSLLIIREKRQDRICNELYLKVSDYDEFKFISETDINNHLKRTDLYPVGKLHSEINLSGMEQELMKMEMVNEVSCSFVNNGNLKIEVTQRVPVFRVKNKNEDYYIDNKRNRMPTSIKFSAYVPVVTGNVDSAFATTGLYDFIDYLDSKNRWSSAFTQLYIYPNNEIELVPRVGDFIIKIGKIENYESKLDKLDKFLEEFPKYYSWDKYSIINLEFKNQVVCTKREH